MKAFPGIEPLEDRIAPATLDVTGGTLTFTAGAGVNNSFTLSIVGANYVLSDTQETIALTANAIAAGFTGSGTNSVQGPNTAVNFLNVFLGDLNDQTALAGLTDTLVLSGEAGTADSVFITGALSPGTGSTLSISTESLSVSATVANAGTVTFFANTMAINSTVTAVAAVTLRALSGGTVTNLGTEVAGQLSLTDAELDRITAPVLRVGSGSTTDMNVTAAITIGASVPRVQLITGGTLTDTAAGSLTIANLAINARDGVTLDSASHDVDSLSAVVTTAGADFSFRDMDDLIVGTVDSIAGITVGTSANGENITLQAGATTQTAGANIIGNGLTLLGAGPFTLNNAGNDTVLLAANIAGALSYTDVDSINVAPAGTTSGITTANNAISITTINGPLTVLDLLAGADVNAGTGLVSLTAGNTGAADHALTINANAGVTGTGGVVLTGDNISIAAAVNAGAQTATLLPFQNDTLIDLGGADSPNTLGLTDAELDFVTAGRIIVGSTTSGNLAISAAINPANTTFLSLRTGGTIDDTFGGTELTETSLSLEAGTGIVGLEIQVTNLEAQTATGGILISNTGAVTIGGIASELTGLSVLTSGNISLTASGSITLADLSGLENVLGGTDSGDVTLSANGATSDISSIVDRDALNALRGDITLTAGRDILFGTGVSDADNDVRADGSITFVAGRDFVIDGFTDISSDNAGNGSGGGVTVTAGRNITVANITGSDASITASGNGGGDITLITGADDFLTLSAPSASALRSQSGNVTVNADRVNISATSGIQAPDGIVTLQPVTAGRLVTLGSLTDAAANTLELSDAELDRISATVLRIGDTANTGNVSMTAAITFGGSLPTLSIRSSAAILGGGSLTGPNLRLSMGGTSALTNTASDVDTLAVDSTAGGFSFRDSDGVAIGTVDGITGITMGAASLVNLHAGATTQAPGANITGTALELEGAGPFTLTNPGNDVNNISANVTGAISFTDADGLTVTDVSGTNGVTTANSPITLATIDGDLTIAAPTPVIDVNAGTSTVTLIAGSAAGQNRALAIQTNAGVIGTGGITLTANAMSITSAVHAGSSAAVLAGSSADRAIDLGTEVAGQLSLTDAELDQITAGILRIGRNDGGAINVSAAVSPAGTSTLSLSSAGNLVDTATGALQVANLALAGNGVNLDIGLHQVGTLAGTAAGFFANAFAFANSPALIVGTVDGIAGVTATSGGITLSAGGALAVDAPLNAAGLLSLSGVGLAQTSPIAQTAGSGAVTLNGGAAAIALANVSNDFRGAVTITAAGAAAIADANDLMLGAQSIAQSLTVTAPGAVTQTGAFSGGGALTFNGPGTLTLSQANTFTGTTLLNGGTLAGTGSLTGPLSIATGATLAPGASPGRLSSGNVTFAGGSTFSVEINGTTPGTEHDQLAVTGTVDLGGATLAGSVGSGPALGTEFVIINNDGTADPVTGTFAGLAEGTNVTLGGATFRITYTGGDGNDVALVTPLPLAVTLINGGKAATFTDGNGDLVTVKTSRGAFVASDFVGIQTGANGEGQLQALNLGAGFAGAKITIKAKQQDANGDGTKEGDKVVNVGAINAAGVDLRSVKLTGDLGQIDAGNPADAKPALGSLSVVSLGKLGLTTQGAAASLHSDLSGDLKKLTVKGTIYTGVSLAVAGRLGTAKITGDVTGATLTALGVLLPDSQGDSVAIKKLGIGGNVAGSRILAGYDLAGAAVNADVSIGKVSVKGTWTASDLVAGIADSTANGFGRDDTLIAGGGDANIIAKIASLTIKLAATGSAAPGTDFFGITAEEIGKAKINGAAVALDDTKNNIELDPANRDFRLVEL